MSYGRISYALNMPNGIVVVWTAVLCLIWSSHGYEAYFLDLHERFNTKERKALAHNHCCRLTQEQPARVWLAFLDTRQVV